MKEIPAPNYLREFLAIAQKRLHSGVHGDEQKCREYNPGDTASLGRRVWDGAWYRVIVLHGQFVPGGSYHEPFSVI